MRGHARPGAGQEPAAVAECFGITFTSLPDADYGLIAGEANVHEGPREDYADDDQHNPRPTSSERSVSNKKIHKHANIYTFNKKARTGAGVITPLGSFEVIPLVCFCFSSP